MQSSYASHRVTLHRLNEMLLGEWVVPWESAFFFIPASSLNQAEGRRGGRRLGPGLSCSGGGISHQSKSLLTISSQTSGEKPPAFLCSSLLQCFLFPFPFFAPSQGVPCPLHFSRTSNWTWQPHLFRGFLREISDWRLHQGRQHSNECILSLRRWSQSASKHSVALIHRPQKSLIHFN